MPSAGPKPVEWIPFQYAPLVAPEERPILAHGRVQLAQDDPSEGGGKVPRSSRARCSRQAYVPLMAHRSGEPHLAAELGKSLHSNIT